MKDRIIRNIPILILWVAGLAINAHMIIPHDHHMADSFASTSDTCPVTNNKPGHHPGFPVHCHACNDLACEKATILLDIRSIQFNDYTICILSDIATFRFHTAGIRVFDFIKLPFKSDIPDLSQQRAPPSLA